MQMLFVDTIQRSSTITFPFLNNLTLNPPAALNVFGRDIYLYGIIIACGFLFGILYCEKIAPRYGLHPDNIYDVMLYAIPLSIVGARAYFVLFNLEYFIAHPSEIPAIWNGGIAIYGGVIAGGLVAWLICRARQINFLAMLDCLTHGLLIGQIMGRWGNFFNREAFGGETEVFCRMGLTSPAGETIYVHPTFLYESLWNLTLLVCLTIWEKKGKRRYDGQVFLIYLLVYGVGRAWIEGLRTDSLYIGPLRVSQILSICMVVFAGVLLIKNKSKSFPTE